MATYLYRKDCIEGRVFETDEEVKKALADGWVDAPGKCKEAPHGVTAGRQTLHVNEPQAPQRKPERASSDENHEKPKAQ